MKQREELQADIQRQREELEFEKKEFLDIKQKVLEEDDDDANEINMIDIDQIELDPNSSIDKREWKKLLNNVV